MRIGFSVKELGKILGIGPNHIKQAIDPAMDKLAMLWMHNPTKTMELLLSVVQERRERYGAAMPEEEIEARIEMAKGRFNRNGHQPGEPTELVPAEPVRALR